MGSARSIFISKDYSSRTGLLACPAAFGIMICRRIWAPPVRGKGFSRHSSSRSLTNLLSARYADDGRKSKGGRMPTNSEATRLNLEYYRKQAKAVLKAAQAGEPEALQRISRLVGAFDSAAPKLHHAQTAVAREQGFASWPRFRRFVVQSGLDDQALVVTFIDAALSDLRRAEELLAAHPKIAGAGFYTALVLGNWHRAEQFLAETPTMAAAAERAARS